MSRTYAEELRRRASEIKGGDSLLMGAADKLIVAHQSGD